MRVLGALMVLNLNYYDVEKY